MTSLIRRITASAETSTSIAISSSACTGLEKRNIRLVSGTLVL